MPILCQTGICSGGTPGSRTGSYALEQADRPSACAPFTRAGPTLAAGHVSMDIWDANAFDDPTDELWAPAVANYFATTGRVFVGASADFTVPL